MKIFGIEISFGGKKSEDGISVQPIRPSTPNIPISRIPSVRVAPLVYAQQFARVNRGVFFLAPEYDLAEIGKVEDTESIVRQAFKKKEGLMFKEGISLRGRNKQTLQYIKVREAQIAQASGIPSLSLKKRVARSLIRTSNAYLVKVRSTRASGGQVRTTADGKSLQPVAAYFPAAPEMFKMDLDPESGKIRHWRQQLPNGWYKLFKPEDVVHFTIDKREGFSYGVPGLVPVLDDIRALRQIEENIELLLYQHLFPLFHYKVGTEQAPAGYTEDGRREIDLVEEQVRVMPSEGMIVTPERHEITAIGSEGRSMQAEGYMNYFKKRVFVGLGMSSVDFGEAETSNKATANVVSKALVDSVKAIQDEFEAQWDQHVIRELLLESTFGDLVLEDDNMVHLQFAEIDLQNKIDHEKHAAEMFKANGITYGEFRSMLGQEPILIPDDPHSEDHEGFPEWHNTYWKLFDEPLNIIRAVDEPWTPQSQMAVGNRSISMTPEQQATSGKQQQEAEKAKLQAKAAAKPKPKVKDSFLSQSFEEFEKDTVSHMKLSLGSRGRIDTGFLKGQARSWVADSSSRLQSSAVSEMVRGFNDQTGGQASSGANMLSSHKQLVQDRISYRLNRLAEDAIKLSMDRIEKHLGDTVALNPTSAEEQLHIAFDALRYRAEFIFDVEMRKAYFYGRLLGIRYGGGHGFELIAEEDSCEMCRAAHGRVIEAEIADFDDIPPFHPNSRMKIRVVLDETGSIPSREEGKPAVAQDDPSAEKNSAVCPKCGKTALWQAKNSNFWCMSCKYAFQKIEDDLNVGGAGTVPTRQPKTPTAEKNYEAISKGTRVCPRCGYTASRHSKNKLFCSKCNYIFKDTEKPRKATGGKATSPMPPKKRKEEAELPASTGAPSQSS